jgi:hypothetical protein
MAEPSWIHKLKQRWKLENTWQIVVVLLVFACTGMSVYYLKRPVLKTLSQNTEHAWWISALYYLLILPVYNVLLLAYGFLFGQFKFFWEFEKRMMRRIYAIFKRQ